MVTVDAQELAIPKLRRDAACLERVLSNALKELPRSERSRPCHFDGIEIKRDAAQSAMWFQAQQNKGKLLARTALGVAHFKGMGVDPRSREIIARS